MINNANINRHGVCLPLLQQQNYDESVEIKMAALCDVLWLDPVEKIDAAVRARMADAGLNILVVNTLDELNTMLCRVSLVVLRLTGDRGAEFAGRLDAGYSGRVPRRARQAGVGGGCHAGWRQARAGCR